MTDTIVIIVKDLKTGTTRSYDTFGDAANAMGLDPHELLWAIEETGKCTTSEHRAWRWDD